MQSTYKVISASAGSGKTYSLVQNLLSICLRYPNQPDKIRNILALTFTNKAASEMKHRIISWLKAFSLPDFENNRDLQNIQRKLLSMGTAASMHDLHERSKNMLDYILHHYSTLNIGTIDKFNSKLIRSFSQELGLAQNFNLEIQPEPYLIEAVDKMLEKIGQENQISETFMDFVHYNLDNDQRLTLNKTLYNSAKEYVQDKHYFELQENNSFDWQSYELSKRKLREDIHILNGEAVTAAEDALNLIKNKNLTIGDFASGANGIGNFFVKFIQNKSIKLSDTKVAEEKKIETYLKGSSTKSKDRQEDILGIIDFLLEQRQKIIQNHVSAEKKRAILNALLPLKVNNDIQQVLAEIEKENDLVLLSKFNVMINENLRDEPTAFIYEKIGTKFSHYFFDEFQDTSTLQWQNFLPLKDHAVSQENMSFTLVGDPKQSIYRFRGGDSQLMLDIINNKKNEMIPATVENLQYNFRSAKNIVKFNNELYRYISTFTNKEHQKIFGDDAQQIAISDDMGRVRVNLIEKHRTVAAFYDAAAEQMRDDIETCLAQGFQFSDITILCRANKEIAIFSQLLGNMHVNINDAPTYIKTISDSGLTLNLSLTIAALTSFLQWEENPENLQFPVRMLYYLNAIGRITMQDFSAETLEIVDLKEKYIIQDFIKNKYDLDLNSNDILHLNLYNFIEHYLLMFSVNGKETDFLFNYLEMLYAYSQNASSTLKEFLKYWNEDAQKTSIQTSENINAVQLMTIHKSKGLEFPIVFLPMINRDSRKQGAYWFKTPDEAFLNSVNIQIFSKGLDVYDDEIAAFNEENKYLEKIDKFCNQYVATTRAVEQLFFYVQRGSDNSDRWDIYNFLATKAPTSPDGQGVISFDWEEVPSEELKKQVFKTEAQFNTQSIDLRADEIKNLDAIKIATPSKNYQNRNEKVRIGIFTHEILAQISTEANVKNVLENYVINGIITTEEENLISERILAIINDPDYSDYFKPNQKVINEKDIMISEEGQSKIYRPDRLIDTGSGIIIIDFKTGKVQEKHQLQLNEYQNALEKIGKKVLKTKIIYV